MWWEGSRELAKNLIAVSVNSLSWKLSCIYFLPINLSYHNWLRQNRHDPVPTDDNGKTPTDSFIPELGKRRIQQLPIIVQHKGLGCILRFFLPQPEDIFSLLPTWISIAKQNTMDWSHAASEEILGNLVCRKTILKVSQYLLCSESQSPFYYFVLPSLFLQKKQQPATILSNNTVPVPD